MCFGTISVCNFSRGKVFKKIALQIFWWLKLDCFELVIFIYTNTGANFLVCFVLEFGTCLYCIVTSHNDIHYYIANVEPLRSHLPSCMSIICVIKLA